MKINHLLVAVILGVFLLQSLCSARAFADGDEIHPSSLRGRSTPTTRQYNDRLPPVLPGEEIETETGQRMRVWSSSGPVPVNIQPTPSNVEGNIGNSGVGVIVDSRNR